MATDAHSPPQRPWRRVYMLLHGSQSQPLLPSAWRLDAPITCSGGPLNLLFTGNFATIIEKESLSIPKNSEAMSSTLAHFQVRAKRGGWAAPSADARAFSGRQSTWRVHYHDTCQRAGSTHGNCPSGFGVHHAPGGNYSSTGAFYFILFDYSTLFP